MMGVDNWPAPERVARFREAVQIIDSMLRTEVTTFEGRYYTAREAAMNPRPVQQPRPPLTIAALGPAMIRIAAAYADTWNTFVERGLTPEEGLKAIHKRNEMLDDYCGEIGREPGEISRSLLVFDRSAPISPFASVGAFEDLVGKYREAGINEFIFYYPPQEWYQSANEDAEEVFERVAREVIPGMRAGGTVS
jgi:hypothetical protein